MSKLDVVPIVRDHFRTFRNDRDGNASVADWLIFVAVPVTFSGIAVRQGFEVHGLGVLLSAIAILVGLLFNLLVLLFDVAIRFVPARDATTTNVALAVARKELVRQTEANTAYEVVVGIALVVVLATGAALGKNTLNIWWSALVILLLTHFLLTLLMIVKRIRANFAALLSPE